MMNGTSSKRTSPAPPMKFVATPRPDTNVRKSIVGPWIERVPAAGPLDLRDLEAAALGRLGDRLGLEHAGVECCRADREAGVVPTAGWPLMWNVLFVEPWTPGQAPVARLYQPAPVFGGAWVSSPLPLADVPFLRNADIVGSRPWRRVPLHDVLAQAVGGEEDRLSSAPSPSRRRPSRRPCRLARRRAARTSSTAIALRSATESESNECMSLRTSPGTGARWSTIRCLPCVAGPPDGRHGRHANPLRRARQSPTG